MKTSLLKSFFSFFIVIFLNINNLIESIKYYNKFECFDINESILMHFIGLPNLDEGTLLNYFYLIFIPIIFVAAFGTYLYNDFVCNSIYIIIRQKNRALWYLKKLLLLLLYSAIYSISYLIPNFFIIFGKYNLNSIEIKNILITIISLFIFLTLFIFIFSLIQNIVSILFGSLFAFLITFGIILLSIAFTNKFITCELYASINPVSGVLFLLSKSTINIYFFIPIFLYTCLIVSIGLVIIKKSDIGLSNKELI